MATFGEITEPGTRTAWEDWDDIVPERSNIELEWLKTTQAPGEIDVLLLFEGKYLSDCVINQNQSTLELVNAIPKVNLQLFKTKTSHKYVCIVRDYNVVLSSEIVELLRDYINASKDVIAIQTKSLKEYRAMELFNQDCIIRMISATKPLQTTNINFPRLEQPNIITGVSAGVISLREHLDRNGVALVCYMEHPEEYQIDEVEKLLGQLNIAAKSTTRPSSVLNSNLYI